MVGSWQGPAPWDCVRGRSRAHRAQGTWGQAGVWGVQAVWGPLCLWVQQTTLLAPLKPSFRVRLLTPSHREKLRLRQVVQLGLAQDVGLGGHTPPPAPWFLYSTVLQPTASPEVDWPETHLFLSSSFCLFLTIFFLKHDILIEMFTKH